MIIRSLLLLFVIGAAVLHAEEGGEQPKKKEREHASLNAYPNAVIEAKEKDGGRVVQVDPNGRDLVCKRDDKAIWRVTVVQGGEIGTPVIRHVSIADGKVSAVVGKHCYVTLDLDTGKITGEMAD